MYKIGDFVLYGDTGVCKVTDISEHAVKYQPKSDQVLLYYVLKPLYQNCVIFSPVSNLKVFIRPIIKKEEAERLIDMIPAMHAEAYHCRVLRQLTEHYDASLKTHDCADWVKLTMSIHAKKNFLEQEKRKLGAVDEKYLKRAEELLFGEMSAALGIPKDQVPDYIEARIQALKNERQKSKADFT